MAFSFCDPAERDYLRDIERLIKRRLTVIGEEPAAAASDGRGKAKKPRSEPRHKRGRRRNGRNRQRYSNRGAVAQAGC